MKVEKRNPALSMSSVSEDLVEDIITKKLVNCSNSYQNVKHFVQSLSHVLSAASNRLRPKSGSLSKFSITNSGNIKS